VRKILVHVTSNTEFGTPIGQILQPSLPGKTEVLGLQPMRPIGRTERIRSPPHRSTCLQDGGQERNGHVSRPSRRIRPPNPVTLQIQASTPTTSSGRSRRNVAAARTCAPHLLGVRTRIRSSRGDAERRHPRGGARGDEPCDPNRCVAVCFGLV
jgi:hypothetical protein